MTETKSCENREETKSKKNLRRIAVVDQILADAADKPIEYIKRFKAGRGGE
jgi:hypothetical protein